MSALANHAFAKMNGIGNEIVVIDLRDKPAVVSADEADFPAKLRQAVELAWQSAPENRPGLLESARAQLDAGREAYRRLRELVPTRAERVTR